MALTLHVDGRQVELPDDGSTLLEVLRERLGLRCVKDGCSPQGQCGCCTVLVDGQPRVACVTPVRRVAGRAITTFDGLSQDVRERWAEAFAATGASQCGFCTPGIIVRLTALKPGPDVGEAAAARALLAHLCRCTGWRTVLEAAALASTDGREPAALECPQRAISDRPESATVERLGGATVGRRDREAAARRAALEGRAAQAVGPEVASGRGGFADDDPPPDALVAVPDGAGGWVVEETLAEARAAAGRVPGRRSGAPLSYPLEVPPGDWVATLRTTWVEPAYVETDASWCRPGGEAATPLGNGGAFGGKAASAAPAAARSLADRYGRPVRVVLSREDAVRLGPKRPPVAAGVRADGTGILRVVRTSGIAAAVRAVAPGMVVEELEALGPPTSATLRGAGWAEAAVLLAVARAAPGGEEAQAVTVVGRGGGRATVSVAVDRDGRPSGIAVRVACGEPLDRIVLRSYCIGAVHMALGWVCSEGIALDDGGVPVDLTIRSFGILRAADMPPVEVMIEDEGGPPVNGSDAVFAATAASVWIAQGLPPEWPTMRPVLTA